jgi:hypothetical protein
VTDDGLESVSTDFFEGNNFVPLRVSLDEPIPPKSFRKLWQRFFSRNPVLLNVRTRLRTVPPTVFSFLSEIRNSKSIQVDVTDTLHCIAIFNRCDSAIAPAVVSPSLVHNDFRSESLMPMIRHRFDLVQIVDAFTPLTDRQFIHTREW